MLSKTSLTSLTPFHIFLTRIVNVVIAPGLHDLPARRAAKGCLGRAHV
jgi:hypothetical protein